MYEQWEKFAQVSGFEFRKTPFSMPSVVGELDGWPFAVRVGWDLILPPPICMTAEFLLPSGDSFKISRVGGPLLTEPEAEASLVSPRACAWGRLEDQHTQVRLADANAR